MRFVRRGEVHYVRCFIVFLIVFPIKIGYCDEDKHCSRDVTSTTKTNEKVVWYSRGIDNEIVVSSPPCTDEYGTLITRICRQNTWIPNNASTLCSRTTKYQRRCPIKFEETSSSCIFVAPPQPWGNICNNKILEEVSNSAPMHDELLWLPYKRLNKYGPFVSTTFGEKFGNSFKKPLKASLTDSNFFEKDCLVVNTSVEEYYPEFCESQHQYICEFPKKDANSRCPDGCVNANLISGSCYCKRNEFCAKLVVVNTIFDYTVLKDLADEDQCYVGSASALDDSFNELKQTIHNNTWFYTDTSLNCSLCLVNELGSMQSQEVDMVLNFDEKDKKLFLTVYSPKGLIDDGDEKFIYCYTNAATYEIKKKEKVDKILENVECIRPYNVYEVHLEDLVGEYYCEAFKNDNEDIKVFSNNVVAFKDKEGNEFSVRIVVKNICRLLLCEKNYNFHFERIFKSFLNILNSQIRVMEIYSFDFESLDFLLHLTTDSKNSEVFNDYNNVKEELQKKVFEKELDIIFIRSSDFCLPEIINNLSWPLTPIGETAVSYERCLQQNGFPVVRACGGDFLDGAKWKEVVGDCIEEIELPDSTKYIYSVLNQTLNDETINNVSDVIKSDPNLPVLSIYYASKVLDKIFVELNNTSFNSIVSTINITDSLLNVNKKNLVYSQELLSVTDDLIDVVDSILVETTPNSDVLLVQRSNVIIHVTNPILSGISGFVVYKEEKNEPYIVNLSRNSSFDDINCSNALIAIKIPEEILNHRNGSNVTVISTIYFKDAFFESNYTKKSAGPVISITIPEFGGYLPSPIPILFRVSNYVDSPECAFWDYGKKSVRKKGKWSTVGGAYLGKYNNMSNFHLCLYSHLTHFSLLRLSLGDFISQADDVILDIITLLGDLLSIFGIAGIFVTAAMFKRWRKKQGTTILINLSASILLEILLLQITDSEFIVIPNVCSIFGILMHYIVICKFCWMLVYSFLQYMRFVKVLTILPENIVIKSIIFGWGFGIIPVAINILTAATYTKKKYNFCYPTGMYLYLGVFLPVALILCINTFVFIAVIKEITSKTVESHGSKENVQKLQIQLACLLFFVLGIPWIFWVFASFIGINWLKMTLIYLYCITSNVQGFILFLFYVVFNTETRQAWLNYVRKKRSKSFSISTKTSSRS